MRGYAVALIAWKVAAAHRIRLTMRSRPGEGTTVELAFPATGRP